MSNKELRAKLIDLIEGWEEWADDTRHICADEIGSRSEGVLECAIELREALGMVERLTVTEEWFRAGYTLPRGAAPDGDRVRVDIPGPEYGYAYAGDVVLVTGGRAVAIRRTEDDE